MTSPDRCSLIELPIDVLIDNILIMLPTRDLLSLSQACKVLYNLIQDTETIWRRKVEKDYRFPINSTAKVKGFKSLYQKLSKPQVWVWGQSRNSRLGLGKEEDQRLMEKVLQDYDQVPTPLRSKAAESIGIIDLQTGGWSFHGLDFSGNIWFWGTLDGLSAGWNSAPHRVSQSSRAVNKPTVLKSKILPKFRAMSCGRSHTIAISDEDELYEWYSWSRISRISSAPWDDHERKIVQISAGWDISAVLSRDGSIYFWREPTIEEASEALEHFLDEANDDNDEAIVYELDSRERILKCPALPESPLGLAQELPMKIATGQDFIICLSSEGKVYKLDVSPINSESYNARFGSANGDDEEIRVRNNVQAAFLKKERYWQYLPMFSESEALKNSLKEALPDVNLERVEPRITHISGQHDTFVAYSVEAPDPNEDKAGENSFVFIGKKKTTEADQPEILPALQQRGVIQVCLGDYHYAALLSNGQLLTWGNYSAGALGLGHPRNPHRKIDFPGREAEENLRSSETPNEVDRVLNPQLVQSFSGSDFHEQANNSNSSSSPEIIEKVIPRRFVFLAAAAGWHTGCLAFTLDEKDDEYGLEVLESDDLKGDEEESDEEDQRNRFLNHHGRPMIRIGYAGRYMRGAIR